MTEKDLPLNNSRLTIINEPVPFSFDELFFSRTDERGIIISGNSVFQKISLYPWEELLKKPHNLIRHPDMTKAVFWLLWHTIKKGEPIGAYVKNRAKDGRYYWVFAIVTPIEGGYLSVRLKPSSQIFSVVEQEYKNLVDIEQKQKPSPEKSGEMLLSRLQELGFSKYQYFMSAALAAEINARNKQLGRPDDIAIANFTSLVEKAKSILEQASNIFVAYESSKYIPLNLNVQAAHLGEEGSTIGVISSNYNIISNEIKINLNNFMNSVGNVFDTINNGLFLTCIAKIQREVLDLFNKEESAGINDKEKEALYLEQQQEGYHKKALKGLQEITNQVESFRQACMEMKKLSTGLEVTRIMGKVESARFTNSQDSLSGLINDLEEFQDSIASNLKGIDTINGEIRRGIEILLKLHNQ